MNPLPNTPLENPNSKRFKGTLSAYKISIAAPVLLLALLILSHKFPETTVIVERSPEQKLLHNALGLCIVGVFILGIVAVYFALKPVNGRIPRKSMVGGLVGLFMYVVLLLILNVGLPSRQNVAVNAVIPPQSVNNDVENWNAVKSTVDSIIKQELANSNGSSNHFNDVTPIGRLAAEYARASSNFTGLAKQTLLASSAFMSQLGQKATDCKITYKAMAAAEVWSLDANDSKDKIQHNRELVMNHMKASDTYSNYFNHFTLNYQAELAARNIPKPIIEKQAESMKLVLAAEDMGRFREMRAAMGRLGKASLELLDLFEQTLGQWKMEPQQGTPLPTDKAAADKFHALAEEIVSAMGTFESLKQDQLKKQREQYQTQSNQQTN